MDHTTLGADEFGVSSTLYLFMGNEAGVFECAEVSVRVILGPSTKINFGSLLKRSSERAVQVESFKNLRTKCDTTSEYSDTSQYAPQTLEVAGS